MRITTIKCYLLISAVLLAGGLSSAQAETYIYQEKDGTRWITDHKLDEDLYTFIDHYGRPTATKSCKGTTPKILERRANGIMRQVRHYAGLYDVEPALVKAVIRVESCFDQHAVSRVGAKGLMQLMPRTAKGYGVTNLFHADDNIRAGVKHLSELLDRFDNLQHSLAAYNAGSTAVLKYKGIPPYKETQGYVKKVMRYYARYKQQRATK